MFLVIVLICWAHGLQSKSTKNWVPSVMGLLAAATIITFVVLSYRKLESIETVLMMLFLASVLFMMFVAVLTTRT